MLLLAGLGGGLAAYASPSVYPTGVTVYDPVKADNTFVLFSGADDKTHLIDMDGNEVKRWEHSGFPSVLLDPALSQGERGHVLVSLEKKEPPKGVSAEGNGLRNQSIGEVDWNDKVVWQWGKEAPGGSAQQHHDVRRLADGDTVVLVDDYRHVDGFALPKVIDDVVYQIDKDGKIKWQWHGLAHLDEFGFTPAQLALVHASKSPDILHVNDLTVIGPNKWYDSGDKRFTPGNLLLDSRNADFIVIIDKDSGKVVWRLGPNLPQLSGEAANKVPRPVDQTVGQHDAHLIAAGLPGAGDLLVFDNQGNAGYPPVAHGWVTGSRVLEIDPVKKEVVWEYSAPSSGQTPWSFYSSLISSARRLPNGNTLIDEGLNGRLFQVTPAGEIVWEYVSPYKNTPTKERKVSANGVYRAQPVSYDWVPAGTPHAEVAVVPAVHSGTQSTAQR